MHLVLVTFDHSLYLPKITFLIRWLGVFVARLKELTCLTILFLVHQYLNVAQ